MGIYSVNILSVCLSVMLQKALLLMDVVILVFLRRGRGGIRGTAPPHGHKFYGDNIIKTNIKLDNRKIY